MVKNSVTRPVMPVLTIDLLKGRLKANSKLNLSVNLLFSLIAVSSSDTTYCVPGANSVTHLHVQFQTGNFPQKMVYKKVKQKNRGTVITSLLLTVSRRDRNFTPFIIH